MAKRKKQWQKGMYNVMAKGREPWREKNKLEGTMPKGRKQW